MRQYLMCVHATLCFAVWCGCSGSEPATSTTESGNAKSEPHPAVSQPETSGPGAGAIRQARVPDDSVNHSSDGSTTTPRQFPSFPNAAPQQPQWVSANTPFDVVAYFQIPEAKDNAEPIYLDALFEFSSDMSVCFGPLDSELPRLVRFRADEADKRSQRLDHFSELWGRSRSSVDAKSVDAWLAEYEVGFENLTRAQQRSQCVFQVGSDLVALMPHLSAARQVAYIVEWRTRRDVAQGKLDRPIQDVALLLRLSRDVRHRSGELGQLVSVAIDKMVYSEIVAKILRSDSITTGHCSRLLSVLQRHATSPKQRAADAIRGEYVVTRQTFHDLQHRTGTFTTQALNDLFERQAGQVDRSLHILSCLALLRDMDSFSSRLAEAKYGNVSGVAGGQQVLPFDWKFDGKLLSDAEYSQEVAVINRVYAAILSALDAMLPSMPPNEALQTWVAPLADTRLALFFEPRGWDGMISRILKSETQRRGTLCLIALRRWLCEHDAPPATLRVAVQSAGMSDVPIDTFTESAMRMTTIGGHPIIYSVGPDGRDDGGQVEWDEHTQSSKGDLLFRLHPEKPKSDAVP